MNGSENPNQDQFNLDQTICILVNGQSLSIQPNTTLEKLLVDLKINSPAIAVELNREIQSRETFANTKLKMDDNLEIVTLVGGG